MNRKVGGEDIKGHERDAANSKSYLVDRLDKVPGSSYIEHSECYIIEL
jgi:hypothetical protein